jgi:hypothetical protein
MPKGCSDDFTFVMFHGDTIWHRAVDSLGNVLLLDDLLIFELGFKIIELDFLPQYKLRQEALASGLIWVQNIPCIFQNS